MLLEIQKIVVQDAISWCNEKNIDPTPFNIVSALDAIGYLKVLIPAKRHLNAPIIKCDMCLSAAVEAVIDTQWHVDDHTGVVITELIGERHYFCEKHTRESESTWRGY